MFYLVFSISKQPFFFLVDFLFFQYMGDQTHYSLIIFKIRYEIYCGVQHICSDPKNALLSTYLGFAALIHHSFFQ